MSRALPFIVIALTAALAVILRVFWSDETLSLIWLGLAPLVFLVFKRMCDRSLMEAGTAAAFGVGALIVRGSFQWLPANWYTDFLGPRGAQDVFTRRPEGFATFFRNLDAMVGVDAGFIFACSALCSALAVAFLVSAFRDAGPGERGVSWPRYTGPLLGVLMVFDPIQVLLGSSDAPHTTSVLAFSLAAWWYREALEDSGRGRHSIGAQSALFFSLSLVGLTRPELALSGLCLPLVLRPGTGLKGLKSDRALWITVLAAVVLGATVWLGRNLFVQVQAVDGDQLGRWAWAVLPPFLTGRGPSPFSSEFGFQVVLVTCFGSFVWGVFRHRRYGLFLALAAYVLLLLPRLPTPFHRVVMSGSVTEFRYDIIVEAVLLLCLAGGAAWLLDGAVNLVRRLRGRRARIATGALMACIVLSLWMGRRVAKGDFLLEETLTYRAEYAFLDGALPRVPQGAPVAYHWVEHLDQGRFDQDLDTGLALPHVLLAFERPDIRWFPLAPGDPLPEMRPLYYHRGPVCSLDPAVLRESGYQEAADYMDDLRRACMKTEKRVSEWIVHREVRARADRWEMTDGTLRLGLGVIRPGTP